MVFIEACFGRETPYTPVWMMRQAGRYLPEYRKVREKVGDFIKMTRTPEVVAEVTLQPVEILNVDAAILFSDILNLPMEMGLPLRFEKGVGPIFDRMVDRPEELEKLDSDAPEKLEYVYRGVELIRKRLPADKALIGFAGSPWTIATYMVEGKGSKQFAKIKRLLFTNPQFIERLLQFNTDATYRYLKRQIEAGADAVMIFDSWGGALDPKSYYRFSFRFMREIAERLKREFPEVPVIIFSKGVGLYYPLKVDGVGFEGPFDVVGVDWNTPIDYALSHFQDRYTLQGNLDPARLYSKKAIEEGVLEIAEVMKGHRHIFNLGHGIFPDVPVENAKFFVQLAKEVTRR